MKRALPIASLVASIALAGAATVAQAHTGFDIMPYYNAGTNSINIGGVTHATDTNPITGEVGPSTKFRINEWSVFLYEFDGFVEGVIGDPGINNEPGSYTDISSEPYTNYVIPGGTNPTGFASGTALFLQALGGLQMWDDSLETFVAATNGVSLSIEDDGILVNGSGFSNNDLFGLGAGGAATQVGNAGLHGHFSTELTPTGPSSYGIYALQAQFASYNFDPNSFTVFDDGINDSAPFWLVFNYNVDDEIFDEAFHFLNGDEHDHDDDDHDHGHGSAVPEPTTASMLAIGAAVLAMRRRR